MFIKWSCGCVGLRIIANGTSQDLLINSCRYDGASNLEYGLHLADAETSQKEATPLTAVEVALLVRRLDSLLSAGQLLLAAERLKQHAVDVVDRSLAASRHIERNFQCKPPHSFAEVVNFNPYTRTDSPTQTSVAEEKSESPGTPE